MARSTVAHPRAPDDKLRNLLDDLAEKAVSAVLHDADATPRAMSDVLKVASGYWAVSRKGEGEDKGPTAWQKYHEAMRGEDESGATH